MTDLLWKLDRISLAGEARPRLDDVSLEIPIGVTAIVGQSGAGKTSLLNLLVGFERPDAGMLTVNLANERLQASGGRKPPVASERSSGSGASGHQPDYAGRSPEDAGHSPTAKSAPRLPLFWVPQNLGLWPHLTVAGHLEAVLPSDGDAGERVSQLLAEFDLRELAGARPDRLSQGERARLSVARAVACGAGVLVMDEPLIHVDPARAGRYWDALGRHLQESNASLVFSTHSPETVLREAAQAVCLSEGRVLFAGPVERLYWQPESPELAGFLGVHNWLAPAEIARWLKRNEGCETASGCCLRPEQIAVVPALDGHLVVESSRFAGSLAEVELRDEASGESRRFYHRPSGNGMAAGTRVVIKVLALLVFCLLTAGCHAGAGEMPADFQAFAMPADGATIPAPRAMHVTADDELYVLDDAGRVLVFDLDVQLKRQWRMPESDVGNPEGLCLLSDGRLAVADTHYHRLVFFDREGKVLGTLGSYGRGPGEFIYPVAIVTDDDGNYYVGEYGENDRVQKFSADGKFLLQFGSFGTEPGQFQRPSGLVWHDHKVYVADAFNNRLQLFSDQGEFLGILGENGSSGGLHYPYDISRGAGGDLFVVEYGAGRLTRLDGQGNVIGRFGTSGTGDGNFQTPWGLTTAGESRVFVADTGNRRIVELKL